MLGAWKNVDIVINLIGISESIYINVNSYIPLF